MTTQTHKVVKDQAFSPIYEVLQQECERLGWPVCFRGDLTEIIWGQLHVPDAPTSFGFGIREAGCDLYLPDSYDCLVRAIWYSDPKRYGVKHHFYLFNAAEFPLYEDMYHILSSLVEIDIEQMICWLVKRIHIEKYQAMRDKASHGTEYFYHLQYACKVIAEWKQHYD